MVVGDVLGVNLRTLDGVTNGFVVDFMAGLIRRYMVEGGLSKVVFIPFGFGSFADKFFDDDIIIAWLLKSRVPELRIITEELSPLQVLCLFNYFDRVIAMRHHAIIFAIKARKPLTAIVYDTKFMVLLRSLVRRGLVGNVGAYVVSRGCRKC